MTAAETPRSLVQRRRKLLSFMVLTMLLYGDHKTVTWLGGGRCRIRTSQLAERLTLTSTALRRYVLWLERFRYVSDVVIGFGFIECTVQPPKDRWSASLLEETA